MTAHAEKAMIIRNRQRLINKGKSVLFAICLFGWPCLIPLIFGA